MRPTWTPGGCVPVTCAGAGAGASAPAVAGAVLNEHQKKKQLVPVIVDEVNEVRPVKREVGGTSKRPCDDICIQ